MSDRSLPRNPTTIRPAILWARSTVDGAVGVGAGEDGADAGGGEVVAAGLGLAVGPAGTPDVAIVLMAIPGPPVMDSEAAEEVRSLMAKGFAGTIFLATDDVHAAYEELKGRGVEFTEEPEERPYGIDSGFRDPSGNSFRLTQVRETATV